MKPHQSIRLFQNPVLEALTHVHPATPFIIWIPVVAFQLFQTFVTDSLGLGWIALFFALGVFFWTLTEYTLHRYLFHFKADSQAGKYLVWLFHGIHHDDPVDPTRLVFPPSVSVPLGALFYFSYVLILGKFHARPFFAGFMSGYLVYDYLHFAVHHFTPKTAWGKNLKEHHMKHHYLKKGGKWGVSSPIWDHAFKTMKGE